MDRQIFFCAGALNQAQGEPYSLALVNPFDTDNYFYVELIGTPTGKNTNTLDALFNDPEHEESLFSAQSKLEMFWGDEPTLVICQTPHDLAALTYVMQDNMYDTIFAPDDLRIIIDPDLLASNDDNALTRAYHQAVAYQESLLEITPLDQTAN